MALVAVSIHVPTPDDVETGLSQSTSAIEEGADIVEWRIDAWPGMEQAAEAVDELVKNASVPSILTVRSVAEGGEFEGTADDISQLLEAVHATGTCPRYIDLEAPMWLESEALRSAWRDMGEDTGLILSRHDMLGRPGDLLRAMADMSSIEEAAVVKIAWRARSARDSIEAFDVLRTRAKPTIALCMGEAGLPTRVLAGREGAFLSFAAGTGGPTAPGQCSVRDLVSRYRFRELDAETDVFCILGDPIAHSISPIVHNAGFADTGFNGVFMPLPVAPGWESFKATVGVLLEDGGFRLRGLCITLPHKEHALRFVKESGGTISDIAQRAGAANTIVVDEEGGLVADNTDAPAIVETLGIEPSGSRIAILGAGGAARAAVAGLVEAGARVDLFNRTPERAQALVEAMDDHMCTLGDLDELSGYDVILNTTSLGMEGGPDPEANPLESLGLPDWMLEEASVVYECVYAPRNTPLVEAARAAGTTVVTGEAMFLAQARRQFHAWTGLEAPFESWRQLID